MKNRVLSVIILNIVIWRFAVAQTINIHTQSGVNKFDLSDIDSITFTTSGAPPDTIPDPVPTTGHFLCWTDDNDFDYELTLVRLNGDDGSITRIGGKNNFPAMTYTNDGTLYGISEQLHIINPADGSTVKIGTFTYEGEDMLMSGAAYSPTGTLYVKENMSPNRVFTVNPDDASITYVGTPTEQIWDLEFSLSGVLYAAFAQFFILDAASMATVKTVGWTGYFLQPMSLGEDGHLYSIDHRSIKLLKVNPTTGKATVLTETQSNGLQSLVVEREPSLAAQARFTGARKKYGLAPEPSMEYLLDIGRRVKQAKEAFYGR